MTVTKNPAKEDCEIAVLIPCLDEEKTIAAVIAEFQITLPDAEVYVYDNMSTDSTPEMAHKAGAILKYERMSGKGHVVRRMFSDIEADIYLLIDGDGTYAPSEAPLLIKRLLEDDLDMVVGTRVTQAGRLGHGVGNRMFNRLYRWLFGSGFTDIFSGYRVLSHRFVKSFPALSKGFEIETEICVHASQLRLPVSEIEISYSERPQGSESKLRTFRDGWNILVSMSALLKENRPMALFGFLSSLSLSAAIKACFIRNGIIPGATFSRVAGPIF